MNEELEKLENPTLQLKLQELYKNPANSGLRSAAVSAESISKLRAQVLQPAGATNDLLLSLEAMRELAALEIEQAKAQAGAANSKNSAA